MGGDRTLRIVGKGDGDEAESLVEVLMPGAAAARDLITYSRNIFSSR